MKRSDSFALYSILTLPILTLAGIGGSLGGFRLGVACGLLALGAEMALFYNSDKRLLARFDVREITDDKLSIVQTTKQTARIAGIAAPKIFLSSSKAPNAFTVGASVNSVSIVVTEGLLEALSKDEQESVIAHEIAHIVNSDVVLMTMLATLTTLVSHIAGQAGFAGRYTSQTAKNRNQRHAFIGILATIAAPIAAAMIQMTATRNREFKADRVGAGFNIRYHELASSLEKIHNTTARLEHDDQPQLAHLFIYASFRRKFFSGLFSTHPPVRERIERLRELALTGGGVETTQ
ncbi:M48 family metalloprotease [bacterium AH-315-F03]|nr:M48 family metalloprotease [bacterium AH-315-F03]